MKNKATKKQIIVFILLIILTVIAFVSAYFTYESKHKEPVKQDTSSEVFIEEDEDVEEDKAEPVKETNPLEGISENSSNKELTEYFNKLSLPEQFYLALSYSHNGYSEDNSQEEKSKQGSFFMKFGYDYNSQGSPSYITQVENKGWMGTGPGEGFQRTFDMYTYTSDPEFIRQEKEKNGNTATLDFGKLLFAKNKNESEDLFYLSESHSILENDPDNRDNNANIDNAMGLSKARVLQYYIQKDHSSDPEIIYKNIQEGAKNITEV